MILASASTIGLFPSNAVREPRPALNLWSDLWKMVSKHPKKTLFGGMIWGAASGLLISFCAFVSVAEKHSYAAVFKALGVTKMLTVFGMFAAAGAVGGVLLAFFLLPTVVVVFLALFWVPLTLLRTGYEREQRAMAWYCCILVFLGEIAAVAFALRFASAVGVRP